MSRAGALVNERKSENPRTEVACVVQPRRAFTIVELLVTISIVALLMGLLMPGLRAAREGARGIQCASNLRQIGIAMFAYAFQHDDTLPSTIFDDDSEHYEPSEMMALTTGDIQATSSTPATPGDWDGLGRLAGAFLDSDQVLYCPCHHGDHPYDQCADLIKKTSQERVYCNYHFIGDTVVSDVPEENGSLRRLFQLRGGAVIVADGMRTPSDLNHKDGANLLREDGSVTYWYDAEFRVRDAFITSSSDEPPPPERYDEIWKLFAGDRD